ncbi:hypothetical protein D039_4974A, partial [Vibrio parahaemolyticus EKP-028]
MGRID